MRSNLGRLDELLNESGEIIITKNNQAIAKVVSVNPRKPFPSNKALRAKQRTRSVSASQMIIDDRDDR